MTLANKISALRIASVPIFLIALLKDRFYLATLICFLSVLTDALDGAIARRFKQKTPLGRFLDPLADKIFLISAFAGLMRLKQIPDWAFILILSRDVALFLGWILTFLLTGSLEVRVRFLGKIATGAQMLLITILLFQMTFPALLLHPPASELLLWATVAITLVSMLDYGFTGSKHLGSIG
ncbi:MAG: CDP-alcohol phosphatidyltransferase family protein [Elusimicrobia bacterium]|nr:CDP-alcohol phosphatidyltransferase family protein [Elusimicrobiota bacterium]